MAESGRSDYDRLVRFTQLEPGEPFFFLRARDPAAGPAVRAYAAIVYKAGAPAALVESALQQADRLDAWPSKRIPDANHLSAGEAKGLEYALQRRAWNHRIAHAPGEAILLAEQRGAAAAIARERHADALLLDLVDQLGPVLTAARSEKAIDSGALGRVLAALDRVRDDLVLRHRREAAPGAKAGELVTFVGAHHRAPPDVELAVSVSEGPDLAPREPYAGRDGVEVAP